VHRIPIFGPPGPVAIIVGAGLPPLPRRIQPLRQLLVLRLLGDVDEQLDDVGAGLDLLRL